ncbi:Cytochrome P450 85A1 [Camellia lanceoleosa]|uniref:Cytochrome P450 85A1 n=1 Tax=Camellia lanceoleosa TaxID=1840588 RepID=A0ACC0HVW4_9ERIC|nr:Cytochrome P450 85A1 [Camellia lanceoleosa]
MAVFMVVLLGVVLGVSVCTALLRWNEIRQIQHCCCSWLHPQAHRVALLSLLCPSIIRSQLLPKLDDFMRCHLSNWDNTLIDIQQKTKEMAFLSSLNQIASIERESMSGEFMPEFFKLVLGTLSLPINFPGTNYHRGFQARKNIVSMLRRLVEERRACQETKHDMLGLLMNGGEENRYNLTDEEIIDQMIAILYSGYETVSTTSMMAVKYLHDHPKVLQELRKEHLAIRERKRAEDPINWNDFKSMKFTRSVIFETSRLATIVNGVLRKTTQDMELNGESLMLSSKHRYKYNGWRIYVYTRENNYDPCLYPDPLAFNPWRWMDKSSELQNYFFMFGGGTRQRWEEVGGDKLMKFPRVEAPNGLHIRVSSL